RAPPGTRDPSSAPVIPPPPAGRNGRSRGASHPGTPFMPAAIPPRPRTRQKSPGLHHDTRGTNYGQRGIHLASNAVDIAMMEPHTDWVSLTWQLEERGGVITVEFHGEIDENVDFTELRRALKGAVDFNLRDIRRINSCGVREWVNFVRELP